MIKEDIHPRASLTTPRAAAIAGILFSVLLLISLVLIKLSVPANPQAEGNWLADNSAKVSLALNLIPFSGIAFLWFIGVIRDRLGSSEDRFFSTVFLGSGLLFLAMLFTSSGVAGSVISLYGINPDSFINSGTYALGRTIVFMIMTVYTMKMAGVFMISTSTLSIRTGIIPRWMAYLGIGLALFLLLSMSFFDWASLLFPMWVLLISIHILWSNLKTNMKVSL